MTTTTTTRTDDSNDCQCTIPTTNSDDNVCISQSPHHHHHNQLEMNVDKENASSTSQTSSQNYFTKENEIESLRREVQVYKQQYSDFNTLIQALKPHPPQPKFLSPALVLNKMKNDGIKKSKLTIDQLTILSIMSGIFIGIAGTLALFTAGNCKTMESENPGLNKFFFGAVFPVGLVLVIMLGTELFTGNNLVLLIGFFSRKWRAKKIGLHYLQVSKNLLISFIFNVLGAAFFAYLFVYLVQPTSDAHWVTTVKNIAVAKVSKTFGQIVLLAIVCNMMVTLAIFVTNAATTVEGKIIGVWFPIMAFASTGYEHSIANCFFIPLGMMYGADVSAHQFLIDNLLPATIGNIIGGSIVVGCFFYYVHDFRSNHPRIVFNLIEKMYEKIKAWFWKMRQEQPVVDEEAKESGSTTQSAIEMKPVDIASQMV